MLTHLSHEQIQHLQSVGRDAQAARAEFILRDDQEKVWDHLKSFAGKTDSRIDFVLDNGPCHELQRPLTFLTRIIHPTGGFEVGLFSPTTKIKS